MDRERMNNNMRQTGEIIDTVFTLKLSRLNSQHPELSDAEARNLIYQGIIERKDRQWKSHTES